MTKRPKETDILTWKNRQKLKIPTNSPSLPTSNMDGGNPLTHLAQDTEWNTLSIKSSQRLFTLSIKVKRHHPNDFFNFIRFVFSNSKLNLTMPKYKKVRFIFILPICKIIILNLPGDMNALVIFMAQFSECNQKD